MFKEIDLQTVHKLLDGRYPLELTNTFALDDWFTIDVPVIVARHHGHILYLYNDGILAIFGVRNEANTMGNHWHPMDEKEAANDIADFMEGRMDYELYPFPEH